MSMTDALRFDPSAVTVRAGETLRFVNDSGQAHTVTAYEDSLPPGVEYFASGSFEDEDEARENVAGGLIAPGETFEVTVSGPGRVPYFCIPHEGQRMTGTIVVEGAEDG